MTENREEDYQKFCRSMEKAVEKIDIMTEKTLSGEAVNMQAMEAEIAALCEQAKQMTDQKTKADITQKLQTLVTALDILATSLKAQK